MVTLPNVVNIVMPVVLVRCLTTFKSATQQKFSCCAQPPTLVEKIQEVFGTSEVPNPESRNLGPNEVQPACNPCFARYFEILCVQWCRSTKGIQSADIAMRPVAGER